jgi:hypothetical protein
MLPPPQKKFLPSTRYTSAMVRLRTKKSVGDVTAASCRFCCKSPKWPGANFPAVKKSDRRPRIDVAPITLPRSPASLSSRNEVPHIFTRKSRVQPKEILITSAQRLLQQNLPDPDSCSAANSPYSITASARASSVGGISKTSAFAVFKLMTSSNLVGCKTGKSPGRSPLRIRPTYRPACQYASGELAP